MLWPLGCAPLFLFVAARGDVWALDLKAARERGQQTLFVSRLHASQPVD